MADKKATEHRNDEDLEEAALREAWQRGKPARITRGASGTSVLSIRMPRELLKELSVAARAREQAPGAFARELIEQGLALEDSAKPWLLGRVLAHLLDSVGEETKAVSKPAVWWGLRSGFVPIRWVSSISGELPGVAKTTVTNLQDLLITPVKEAGKTGRAGLDKAETG
jgi:hypothetical protein